VSAIIYACGGQDHQLILFVFDLDSGFVVCFPFPLFGSAQKAIKQQAGTVSKENAASHDMSSNAVTTAGAAYDAVNSKAADATAVAEEYTQRAGQCAEEKYSAEKGSVGQVLILARIHMLPVAIFELQNLFSNATTIPAASSFFCKSCGWNLMVS
jgi:hypothetical protein